MNTQQIKFMENTQIFSSIIGQQIILADLFDILNNNAIELNFGLLNMSYLESARGAANYNSLCLNTKVLISTIAMPKASDEKGNLIAECFLISKIGDFPIFLTIFYHHSKVNLCTKYTNNLCISCFLKTKGKISTMESYAFNNCCNYYEAAKTMLKESANKTGLNSLNSLMNFMLICYAIAKKLTPKDFGVQLRMMNDKYHLESGKVPLNHVRSYYASYLENKFDGSLNTSFIYWINSLINFASSFNNLNELVKHLYEVNAKIMQEISEL